MKQLSTYTTTKGVVHDRFCVTVLWNVTIWHNLWRFSSYCHGLRMGSFDLHQWARVLWQNICDRHNMTHKTSWIGWNNCDEYNVIVVLACNGPCKPWAMCAEYKSTKISCAKLVGSNTEPWPSSAHVLPLHYNIGSDRIGNIFSNNR